MATGPQTTTSETPESRRERFRNHFYRQVRWEDLDPAATAELIDRAAREDLEGFGFAEIANPSGDPTSELFLAAESSATATLTAREPMTLAGLRMIPAILDRFDPALRCENLTHDGQTAKKGTPLARISGPARSLFSAERTLLNFIQLLSGVATATRPFSTLLENSSTRLLDTRKTHPGYRALIKYAVAAGGGWNHRLGLYDRIMLKDNHLGTFRGSIQAAVAEAKTQRPDLPIQVEVDSVSQLPMVLEAEPDIILLDNFSASDITKALDRICGQTLTEISGNVTLETLPQLAPLGADFISTGATVHQSRWVDIGLDLEK